MKNYLKIFNTRKSSAGFTLIELLVAASLTSIVVSGAGFGLVSIMQADKEAKSQNYRRFELNRALDFIADEVRQANAVNQVSAPIVSKPLSTTASAIVEPGTEQSILVLQIPNVVQPVVYHIAQPKSNSVWLGPRVIYRWGPPLAEDGTYTNINDSSSWENQPLVDLVEDSKPIPNPICADSWTPKPSAPDRKGFYVCVDPNGRIAKIHMRGRLQKAYATSTKPYEVSSKIFGRPSNITLGAGGSDLFSVDGGTLTFPKSAALNFKVIGSSITCGPGGATIPTTAKLLINKDNDTAYEEEISVNTSVPVDLTVSTTYKVEVQGTALATNCVGTDLTYKSTNTNQVFALRNGDPVPGFTPFDNQTTIKSYLQEYSDPVTKKISIANNEVIYLFELGSTDKNSAAFDSQDLVVLATTEPA